MGTWKEAELETVEKQVPGAEAGPSGPLHRRAEPASRAALGGRGAGADRPGAAWRRAAPVVEAILEAHAAGRIHQDLAELAWSYAHMHCNRLGIDPTPEALLRYFMHRLVEDGGGPPPERPLDRARSPCCGSPRSPSRPWRRWPLPRPWRGWLPSWSWRTGSTPRWRGSPTPSTRRRGSRRARIRRRRRGRLAVIALRRALHNRRRVSAAQLEAARPRAPPGAVRRRRGAPRRQGRARGSAGRLRARVSAAISCGRGAPCSRWPAIPLFRRGCGWSAARCSSGCGPWRRMDPGRWRHDERHAAAKLAAYAGRFATKTSPNAVFCATALAWIGGGGGAGDGGEPAGAARRAALGRRGAQGRGLRWGPAAPPGRPSCRAPTRRCAARTAAPGSSGAPPRRAGRATWRFSRAPRAQPVLDLFFEEAGKGTLAVPELLAAVAGALRDRGRGARALLRAAGRQGDPDRRDRAPLQRPPPAGFVAEAMREAGC